VTYTKVFSAEPLLANTIYKGLQLTYNSSTFNDFVCFQLLFKGLEF